MTASRSSTGNTRACLTTQTTSVHIPCAANFRSRRPKKALSYYFGRTPTFEELRHNFAYVAFAGWCWYVWSLMKEAEGDVVGEWLYIYYRYAKRYLSMVLPWYEQGKRV